MATAEAVRAEAAELDEQDQLALELERALEEEEGDASAGGIEYDDDEEGKAGDGKRLRGAHDGRGGEKGEPLPPPPPEAAAAAAAASPLAALLPDEVLIRIVTCVGTGPTQLGRVCRQWERARVQVIRERHVATLVSRIEGLPERLAREIEMELFLSTDRRVSSPEYKAVLRRVLLNLKLAGGTNPSLRTQVLSGQLPPHRLVRLSPEEWLSEEARALRDEAGKAAHKRISLSEEEAQAQAGRVLSRAYQCSRCGQSRCWVRRWRRKPQVDRYRLLITCANCGLEWDE